MDRLDSLGSAFAYREPERRKKVDKQRRVRGSFLRSAGEGTRKEFASLVGDAADAGSLEDLLDEVNESGERLQESQSLENIRVFREAVRSFLAHVMKRALDVVEHESGAGVRKRKRFALVEVIDGKLESLATAVLAGQADQMEILRRIDEIRGLLVDLLT
jgi:uncharacterized protein